MTPPAVEGKRGNVEEKKVLSLLRGVTGEDSSLHCRTIGNSLIRGDALVGLLAIEEVGHKFDDARNTCGTANQDDFMDVQFVNFGIAEDLLDRVESTTEEILAQLFETSTSEGGVEVDTSKRESISNDVWEADERVRLARSQAVRRRRTARGVEEISK
jgi:hypothetical protein